MRSYLAVIKDSFREAFASRLLWILLAILTLLLILLAGFGLKVTQSGELSRTDFLDPKSFVRKLVAASTQEEPSLPKQIWERLPEPLRQEFLQTSKNAPAGRRAKLFQDLRHEVNQQLGRADFYDAKVFEGLSLKGEARDLVTKGVDQLTPDERARLHRLALDAAFRGEIAPAQEGQVYLTYFGWSMDDPLPLRPSERQATVRDIAFELLKNALRRVGVFIAILVTAPIVPRMFNSGEVDLLFSRPVRRWLLFLAKFAGGCAFALLLMSYFVAGVWLILGLRHDLWHPSVLLSIPIFLLVFATYYSVSAVAGVVYRNTVLAVGFSVLFWFLCWTVGMTHDLGLALYLNGEQAQEILPVGGDLLVAQKSGEVQLWSTEKNGWKPVFDAPGREVPRMQAATGFFYRWLGPVPYGDGFAAIEKRFGNDRLSILGNLMLARREEDWQQIRSVAAPGDTTDLLPHPTFGLLAVGPGSFYRLEGDPTEEPKPQTIFGVKLPFETGAAKFVEAGPRSSGSWKRPFAAAVSPGDGRVAVFEGGRLHLLAPTDEKSFEEMASRTDFQAEPTLVAVGPKGVVLAAESGRVDFLSLEALRTTATVTIGEAFQPKTIRMSPDGELAAVLSHQKDVRLFDLRAGKEIRPKLRGQGRVTAIAFNPAGRLLTGDRFPRITEQDPRTGRVKNTWQSHGWVEKTFLYGVEPLHRVFPIPADMDNVAQHYLGGTQSATVGDRDDLRSERAVLTDVWTPLWKNLAFLTIVLGLTCVYVSRKDF